MFSGQGYTPHPDPANKTLSKESQDGTQNLRGNTFITKLLQQHPLNLCALAESGSLRSGSCVSVGLQ